MDSRKLFGFAVGVVLFLLTVLVGANAFYTWKSGNKDVTFNIGDSYFYCESGQTINQTGLSPVLDYRKSSYHTFKVNNIGKADTKFSVTLNIKSIDDALKSTSFKYKLVVDKTGGSNNCVTGSGCEEVSGGSGNFSKMKVGMNTIAPSIDLPNNTRYQYYLFMYIDGNMANNTAMQTSKIESVLEVCEIIATLDYNYGNVVDNKEYLKVSATYAGLPETVTRNTTTITYNSQGGSNVASHHITYAFGGWYLENTYKNRVTASSKVNTTINHTLYAKWNQSWVESTSTPKKSNGVILPNTSKTGYTFQGWFLSSSGGSAVGQANSTYNNENSVTLYAQWIVNKYTVTLDSQGATSAGTTSVSATYDSAMPKITPPSKSYTVTYNYNGNGQSSSKTTFNYSFGGYFTESNGNGTKYYNADGSSAKNYDIASNKTMYAKWTSTPITLPNPTWTGYTFNGWYDKNGTRIADGGASYTPTANITLVAHWTANIYKVTLDNQRATSSGTQEVYYQYNTTKTINGVVCYYYTDSALTNCLSGGATITKPSKTGYTFGGYYTSTNGGGTNYVNADGLFINNIYATVGNKTLYAKWTANIYKVILDNQRATSSGTQEVYYQYNTTKTINGVVCYYYTDSALTNCLSGGATITKPSKTGYTFGGYYTSTNGGGTNYVNADGLFINNIYVTVGNKTLYAKWTANPLNFSNQKITKTYSTSAQTASITPATNGTGSYTYTEVSEKNASGTSTNYISISGTTINIAASTPAGTYSYVIRASDNNSKVTKDATYTIIINRANTATTGSCKNPTYNGASQTLAGSGSYVSYGNNSGTNATSYTVSVTADSNHTFSDGTTSKTLSCSIGKRTTTCTSGSLSKVWDGSALTNKTGGSCTNLVSGHAATFSGHTGSITNVGSTSNGFGSVVIRINATTMDVTGNYSITKKNGTLTVTKANTAATGSCKSLTYSGSAQTLASGGSYVSYGNNSGTNAGSYTVNVTADSNHTFSDGTTSKTLSCSIGKATPTITLSATSGTITGTTLTFTEKANVAGKFTNTSGNTGIATVSPASNSSAISANTDQTVTVTSVSTGSSSITVNFSPTDTTNYNNASAKTYTVTVKNQYTITYNNNGGSGCTTKNNVSAGKAIGALCTPSQWGYNFSGWFTAASGGNQVTSSTIMGASNMTVYAHWSAKQIKIKYDANGGSGKMYTTVYTYSNDGSYVNFSTNTFTKTGHTFAGWHIKDDDTGLYFGCTDTSKCTYGVSSGLDWYDSSQSGFKYFTPGTDGIWKISRGETENDVTAIAQWTPNEYTVTYNGNMFFTTSKTSGGINVTYDYNNSYITLNGTASSQVGIDFGLFGETLSQNLQFKTTLTYVSGSYSGSGCIATEIRKADGGSLSTRNWVDVGFPTSGSSSGVLTVSATAASEGSRVYSWLYLNSGFVFNNYKIKINITKLYTKSVTYASTYGTSYTPVRIGHTFAGWYTAESGGTAVSSTTTVTNPSNHTLYAHWSANTYTVSYNANGGTGAPSAQSFVFNSDTRISTTKPTRVGYTFLNWIYGGVGLNPGAAIPKGWGNFTLTAYWIRNFTCEPVGHNTTYAGKTWTTLSKNDTNCVLALNATSSATGIYQEATTNLTREYFTSGTLLAEKNAGLVASITSNGEATNGTYASNIGGAYWINSGRIHDDARTQYTCSNINLFYGVKKLGTTKATSYPYKNSGCLSVPSATSIASGAKTVTNALPAYTVTRGSYTKTAVQNVRGTSSAFASPYLTEYTGKSINSDTRNVSFAVHRYQFNGSSIADFSGTGYELSGNIHTKDFIIYSCGGAYSGRKWRELKFVSSAKATEYYYEEDGSTVSSSTNYTTSTIKNYHLAAAAAVKGMGTLTTPIKHNDSKNCTQTYKYAISDLSIPIHYRLVVNVKL